MLRRALPFFGLFLLMGLPAVSRAGQIPQRADRPPLELLAGEYQAQGQRVLVTLRPDGVLTFAVPPQPAQELQPLSGLRFAQKGLAGYSVEFVRDPAGNVVALLSHQPNGTFTAGRVSPQARAGSNEPHAPAARGIPPAAPGARASAPIPSAPPPPAPAPARNQPPPQTAPPSTQAASKQPPAAETAAAQRPQPVSPPATAARAAAATTNAPAGTVSVASCDALAAHPDDDGKPSGVAGVADEVIVAARAIPACAQAVEASPKDGRLHFQLGRAYWAAKRHGDAIDSFLKAEELKYAAAYFYLAEAYDYGLVEGEKADPELATALYALAAEGGFLPAKAMLGLDASTAPLQFDPAAFARPNWIAALHAGDIKTLKLRASRGSMVSYLAGMHYLLVDNPREYGPDCAARIDRRFTIVLEAMVEDEMAKVQLENPTRLAAAEKASGAIRQDGVDDMYLLVSDYGGCTSEAFERIYATLKSYVTGAEPAQASSAAPADEQKIVDSCIRREDFLRKTFSGRYRSPGQSEEFCRCAAPKIAASALPPLDRNAFADNWAFALSRLSAENYNKILGPLLAACTTNNEPAGRGRGAPK